MAATEKTPALAGLSAVAWAQLFGLERLARATQMHAETLRRVLTGTHAREPLRQLDAIATATSAWAARRRDGAPRDLGAWRELWAAARALHGGGRRV